MTTKPLIRQFDVLVTSPDDVATINRLLAATAISPRFRASLLSDPKSAVQAGFGGESFTLSQATYSVLTSIEASSLQDFVHKLGEIGVYHLAKKSESTIL